ncbi:hypothetical protein AAG906_012706 [Vitis piasezkii]
MASAALPHPVSPPSPHATTATPAHEPTSLPPKTPPKPPTIRSRLSHLCRQGHPHQALHLFDSIPRPTTVLWNTIIIGFICNNMPIDALLFYARMRASPSPKFDSYTFSSTLKACAQARSLKLGKALHCHVLRSHFGSSRIVYNSLLNMYSTCLTEVPYLGTAYDFNNCDLVRRVFDTMRKRNVVAWNTMISWYVKTERLIEAFKMFRTMMRMGIRPTPVSFVNVFPAVWRMNDYDNANVLYGLVVKLGSDYVDDFFVVSSAIFMYAELGCVDFAREIFDCCLERNTEVWNTMIGGYVQNNCPIEAIDLFVQVMESEQFVLDDVTFLSALTAISQLQWLDLGRQLHAYILKSSTILQVVILNAIIVMYSRCGSIGTSFKVFSNMLERDVVTWNTMVSAFVQNGLDDEGLMLVFEMQKQGFMVDSVTLTALLSLASNLRSQEIGKQAHAYLIRHGIQFEGMDSYLIDMYAKSGLITTAQQLFEKNSDYDRDEATWNAMIAGYTQNGLSEEGFAVFRKMIEQNVRPNAVTLASILPACNPMGTIGLGKQIHGFAIRCFLNQNVFVGTALLDMYSKSGAITYAENVFAETLEKNSVTYTTMILSYGQHGMGERALSLFHAMLGSGIKPDSVTFVAILSACSYAGLVDEGLRIFQSMEREYKIQPSAEHYCCVADMLGRVGRVVEAYEFVKGLGEEGNTFGIWGSLLGACRIHGEFELGKVVANKLLEMEKGSSLTGYHVLLSNIYAAEGNWDNVDRVRKEMRQKGLMKEAGCSWVEVAGHVNCFMSRDHKHPQCAEIYQMLEKLAMEMKDAGYKPCLNLQTGGISASDE